jgi:hypothetical protein
VDLGLTEIIDRDLALYAGNFGDGPDRRSGEGIAISEQQTERDEAKMYDSTR